DRVLLRIPGRVAAEVEPVRARHRRWPAALLGPAERGDAFVGLRADRGLGGLQRGIGGAQAGDGADVGRGRVAFRRLDLRRKFAALGGEPGQRLVARLLHFGDVARGLDPAVAAEPDWVFAAEA